MIENMYELMNQYNRKGIVFSFNGVFSEIMVNEIVVLLKKISAMENASQSAVYNLFSVVVELLQNINRYSAKRTLLNTDNRNDTGLGIIFAGLDGNDFFIMSGNPVETDHIVTLQEKLTTVQQMNKDELRRYYKSELKKKPDQNAGGVGLIEVARKASRPIQFRFDRIDDRISFFSIKIYIHRN
jgi:hypothetical protein